MTEEAAREHEEEEDASDLVIDLFVKDAAEVGMYEKVLAAVVRNYVDAVGVPAGTKYTKNQVATIVPMKQFSTLVRSPAFCRNAVWISQMMT